jgi:hypothetical protein
VYYQWLEILMYSNEICKYTSLASILSASI